MFEDDLEIKGFLECIEEFVATQIDNEEDIDELAENIQLKNTLIDQKIIELRINHIPKGLVPLEILFDSNDVYLKSAK